MQVDWTALKVVGGVNGRSGGMSFVVVAGSSELATLGEQINFRVTASSPSEKDCQAGRCQTMASVGLGLAQPMNAPGVGLESSVERSRANVVYAVGWAIQNRRRYPSGLNAALAVVVASDGEYMRLFLALPAHSQSP